MSTIQNIFEQAQLAEAAYADFTDPTKTTKQALMDSSFSDAQATAFVTDWRMVSQYTAQPELLGLTDGTGFSATLFQNIATGGYIFAVRGTEAGFGVGYADLLGADFGDIVSDGLALDQTIDMYNYWQSLHSVGTYQAANLETSQDETSQLNLLRTAALLNPAAQLAYNAYLNALKQSGAILDSTAGGAITLVRRISFGDSDILLADTALAQGNGKLSLGDTADVTGHSLGGHLAVAFTRLFDTVGATATTINGAGFPTGSTPGLGGNAISNIQNLFTALGGASAFDASSIFNVHGDGLDIGPDAAQDTMFYDAASGVTINLGSIADSADSRRRFMFGADNKNDMFTGGSNSDRFYGMDGDDTLTGNDGNDWLEGGAGADQLTGGAGADRLYGGADNDTLDGGLGNDTLVGGAGTDTYAIKTGEGTDTLLDAGGDGIITLDGAQIKGSTGIAADKWKQLGPDLWLDTENNITYSRTTEGGTTQLLIHQGTTNILVRDWQEGALGIALGEESEEPPVPQPTGAIEGDHPVLDQDPVVSGIQPGYDNLNNLKTDYGVEVERQDILHGGLGNDLIRGYTNIDYLSGGVGDDVLEGNAENDVFYRETA